MALCGSGNCSICRSGKKVIVPELNYSGQIAGEVRKIFDLSIPVIGVNVCGGVGITPQQIMQAIE